MNGLTIEKIIMSHLLTLPNFDKSKVARVNHNFTPPVTGVWYRVNITGGVNTVACINDTPCTREIGTLIIQVFDRENTGTAKIKQACDELEPFCLFFTREFRIINA
ncbi:phage tail terminator-like protein [Moraxella boevrei]|uniref:phage tail terminator-like protein n=1 Tax=Faucicola boevrei TaxID=346665 RepID=UPI0037361A91